MSNVFSVCRSAGVPQRETMLCVDAATLMTALQRLERKIVDKQLKHIQVAQPFTNKCNLHNMEGYSDTMTWSLSQLYVYFWQKTITRRTHQLDHFSPCHAPIGQAVCQSITKDPFSNFTARWVQGLLRPSSRELGNTNNKESITYCFFLWVMKFGCFFLALLIYTWRHLQNSFKAPTCWIYFLITLNPGDLLL